MGGEDGNGPSQRRVVGGSPSLLNPIVGSPCGALPRTPARPRRWRTRWGHLLARAGRALVSYAGVMRYPDGGGLDAGVGRTRMTASCGACTAPPAEGTRTESTAITTASSLAMAGGAPAAHQGPTTGIPGPDEDGRPDEGEGMDGGAGCWERAALSRWERPRRRRTRWS